MKTLIEALRCSATVGSECDEECPWRLVEQVPEDSRIRPDYELAGNGYWVSCNCEKIALDAANELEKRVNMEAEFVHLVYEAKSMCNDFAKEMENESQSIIDRLIELKLRSDTQ